MGPSLLPKHQDLTDIPGQDIRFDLGDNELLLRDNGYIVSFI